MFSFQTLRRAVLLLVMTGFFMACSSRAQVSDTFYNNTLYTSIANINATNFLNDYGGTFSVTPGLGSGWLADLYQAWRYTRNFTNYADMNSNTGFRFDRLISGHTMATSFYNAGNINCGTGFGAIFIVNGVGLLTQIGGFGGIYVWSTNIFNSGTITIGSSGLGQMSAQNIEFNHGTVTMQNFQSTLFGQTNTATPYAVGQTGKNTNDWVPADNFTPTSAIASPPPLTATFSTFFLPNTTPYFDIQNQNPSNVVVRMVFIQNDTVNVPYNVYFHGSALAAGGITNAGVAVEWVGSYTDPVTGSPANNYLYLANDYIQGASTNALNYISPGIPKNFAFYVQNSPLTLGVPQASNFPSIFPTGPFPAGQTETTNIFSYVNAQFVASTISTNSVVGGALTNLAGRFEISATNELNLSLSTISGMNYLLLKSTNNFDTDFQSQISVPYADVYLGRTNGTFVVSNLLQSTLPFWSGSIQCWNSRWFYTDTNAGVTYDFRMLMVESGLTPTSTSQQQDFVLYSSNNVIMSDALNISRTLSLNCTNLLLSTNGFGNGAGSAAGELNLSSSATFWASSTPRLRVLTNNGVISTVNLTAFGSAAVPYYNFVNSGYVYNAGGTSINANDFENYGQIYAGLGSFYARSVYAVMTNATIFASGSFTNITGTLIVSNVILQAGRGMTMVATNLLTDGSSPFSYWYLGSGNGGAGIAYGLNLSTKPVAGDLLGTTIYNIATANSKVNEIWSGEDRGYSIAGYSNNVAVGQLVLDALGTSPLTQFYFSGSGASNAMYVDNLILLDYSSYTNRNGTNLLTLAFNTNLVIYYAQATLADGTTVAEKINHFNSNHLRWMPNYAGYFSSTNLVYPPGVTNTVNAALAQSSQIDSDGDGIANSADATPFFTPALLNFTIALTNNPSPKSVRLQWQTIPNSTNYIFYKTNLLQDWSPFTNFNHFYYGANVKVTNAAHVNWFPSPLTYPSNPPVSDLRTNVWVFDVITNTPHFYRVLVQPWLTYPN